MINKTLKKLITFSPRNLEMMEEIAIRTGWSTPTEIIKRGLEELHSRYYPAYRAGQSAGLSEEAINKQAEIKARAKEKAKGVALDQKYARKMDLCVSMLGGEVVENANGSKVCVFTQYTLTEDSELTVPIAQVDPIIADTSLFLPSKEAVLKARPELKDKLKFI